MALIPAEAASTVEPVVLLHRMLPRGSGQRLGMEEQERLATLPARGAALIPVVSAPKKMVKNSVESCSSYSIQCCAACCLQKLPALVRTSAFWTSYRRSARDSRWRHLGNLADRSFQQATGNEQCSSKDFNEAP